MFWFVFFFYCFIWLLFSVFLCSSYSFLKSPMFLASTTSGGSLFHLSTTLFGKLYFLTSFFPLVFWIFSSCPLVPPCIGPPWGPFPQKLHFLIFSLSSHF